MQFQAPYSLVPAGSFALHFHPEHLIDLRASGLSDETIKAAGVYSIRPRDIRVVSSICAKTFRPRSKARCVFRTRAATSPE